MKNLNKGKVFLVGAGPGDPELITVKGYNVLKKADVILYDRLVNIELLKGLKAEKVFVGKKKNIHYYTQDEINGLLIDLAKSGKAVVRLKGGDPLIFGRGGEEIAALIKHGIDFEMIPGLSSGTAVASNIGLPLTHRELASSVAIITGHRKKGEATVAKQLPKADTLVFLMGLSALSKIVDDLIRAGYSRDSKIAVISKGTYKSECYISGRLSEIVKIVKENKFASPAVVIYGKVVHWYDDMIRLKESEEGKALLEEIISVCT
jgi:uroporphyrin-III C-methyltransferase